MPTRGLGAEHDHRRSEIARAVLAVVADRGLQAVSLNTVAAQAGVSPGRVQYYFPTKTALLEAGFEQANADASARVTALVGGDQDAAVPRQLLTVVLVELIPHDEQARTHLRIRQSFAALALYDETIAARMRTEYEQLHHRALAGLLRRDQENGQLPATLDPVSTAVRLVALAEGLAYYALIGVSDPADARDHLLAAIGELYS